jgi:hypothetical protein
MSLLLALPEPCLLAVLQYCASDDLCSVFSAASAHSKLHQAAVAALCSFKAPVRTQQQVDGVLLYLSKHGHDVDSVDLKRTWSSTAEEKIALRQLPPILQLSSLQLSGFDVQLQPGGGFQGVLGAAATVAALKQLSIICEVLDGAEALFKSLWQLAPGLQDLRLGALDEKRGYFFLQAGALQHLHNLTTLSLSNIELQDNNGDTLGPSLQAMARLVDLRLSYFIDAVTVKMLAGAPHLTRLEMEMNGIHPGPCRLCAFPPLCIRVHECLVA